MFKFKTIFRVIYSKTTFVTVNHRSCKIIQSWCLYDSKTTFVTVNLPSNTIYMIHNPNSKTTFVTVNHIVNFLLMLYYHYSKTTFVTVNQIQPIIIIICTIYSKTTFVTVNPTGTQDINGYDKIQKQHLLLLILAQLCHCLSSSSIQKQHLLLLICAVFLMSSWIISNSKTTFVTVNLDKKELIDILHPNSKTTFVTVNRLLLLYTKKTVLFKNNICYC